VSERLVVLLIWVAWLTLNAVAVAAVCYAVRYHDLFACLVAGVIVANTLPRPPWRIHGGAK
jgi:hypothetical protein